jgi:hypothetical protein
VNQSQKLFTIILEFDGVNSVSQVHATSPDEALQKWSERIGVPGEYGLKHDDATMLMKMIEEARDSHRRSEQIFSRNRSFVGPLNEVRNVWCLWLSMGNRSALINIVGMWSE